MWETAYIGTKRDVMAKDFLHETVKQLLREDGWAITDDPYRIGTKPVWEIDLGAEKWFAAERGLEKIAVEVKSFKAASFAYEFHSILGQYLSYRSVLNRTEQDRTLYLAVPVEVYAFEFSWEGIANALADYHVRLIVYEPEEKRILQWI